MKSINYTMFFVFIIIYFLNGCARPHAYLPSDIYKNIHKIGLLAILTEEEPKYIDLNYSPSSLKDSIKTGSKYLGAVGALLYVAIDQSELHTSASNDLKSIKPELKGVSQSGNSDLDYLKLAIKGFNVQQEFNDNFFIEILKYIEKREDLSSTIIDPNKYKSIQGEDLIKNIKNDYNNLDAIFTVFYAYGLGQTKEGGFKPAIFAQVSIVDLRNDTILMSEVSPSTALYISSHSFMELSKNNAELFRSDFRKVAHNFGGVVAINNF